MTPSTAAEVRALLELSYYAFYAKFPQLTPIQLLSAAPISQGQNCLLTAPTASGKTQAYLAPLVQRYFARLRDQSATVLIVSPTRALVNDLFRRLSPALERCGIGLSRRTGDFRAQGEAAFSGVVLTTPESLDSVLCRQPRWLGNTQAVVLDEVHLVANTCRGSQLEILLSRLDAVVAACQNDPSQTAVVQRVAVSATVENSSDLMLRYLGAKALWLSQKSQQFPRQVTIVREVEAAQLWKLCLEGFRSGANKLLFFLPTRRAVEETAQALRDQAQHHRAAIGSQLIYVHHAALSRANRLLSEKSFLSARQGVLLTTSSLEVGLDIGDVDGILLWGPPPDVTSLLQRVGRGGRRGQSARLWCLCPSPQQALQMQHLLDRAQKGLLCQEPLHNFYSVLFQQAASLAFQNRGGFVASSALWQRLGPRWQQLLSQKQVEECLDHWREKGFYRQREGRYFPDQRLESQHFMGKLHSNIAEQLGQQRQVVEAETGRTIGFVTLGNKPQQGESQRGAQTVLAGARRRILSTQGQGPLRAMITSANCEVPSVSEGKSKIGLGVVGQAAQVRGLRLTTDFGQFLGLDQGCGYLLRIAGFSYLFHFCGELWGIFLGDFLRFALRKIKHGGGTGAGASDLDVSDNGLYLKTRILVNLPDLQRLHPLWLERLDRFGPERQFSNRLIKLGRLCQCGPWFGQLPSDLQQRQLSEITDYPGYLQWFKALQLQVPALELQSCLKMCVQEES